MNEARYVEVKAVGYRDSVGLARLVFADVRALVPMKACSWVVLKLDSGTLVAAVC